MIKFSRCSFFHRVQVNDTETQRNLTFAITLQQKVLREKEKKMKKKYKSEYPVFQYKFTLAVAYFPQINKTWIPISIFVYNIVLLCIEYPLTSSIELCKTISRNLKH